MFGRSVILWLLCRKASSLRTCKRRANDEVDEEQLCYPECEASLLTSEHDLQRCVCLHILVAPGQDTLIFSCLAASFEHQRIIADTCPNSRTRGCPGVAADFTAQRAVAIVASDDLATWTMVSTVNVSNRPGSHVVMDWGRAMDPVVHRSSEIGRVGVMWTKKEPRSGPSKPVHQPSLGNGACHALPAADSHRSSFFRCMGLAQNWQGFALS
eukprot:1536487-Amphidinium_carterae.2